jgi:hypothetical protein
MRPRNSRTEWVNFEKTVGESQAQPVADLREKKGRMQMIAIDWSTRVARRKKGHH